jgi:hypothetical protein
MSSCIYYSCLFTKHKSQKRKIWQDGKLKISPSGSISIYDIGSNIISGSDATPVDTMCIHTSQVGTIKSGSELESEKFLITVEGEWRQQEPMVSTSTSSSNVSHASVSTNSSSTSIHQNSIKAKNKRDGMKKLLVHKFRKPTKFIPGGQNQSNHPAVIRKAPLQPGQYMQQFQGPSIRGSSNDSSLTSIQHNVGLGGGMHSYNSGSTRNSHPFHHDIRHERYPHEYKRDEQNIPIHPSNGQSTTPVNNLFGDHPSSKQTMPSTKQTKSCNNNAFVSNEFNPSSYYEESDEEGEKDDDERTVHHWNNNEHLEPQKKNFESNTKHHPLEQDRDEYDQDHLSKDDGNSQTGDTLSKSEWMDLFAPRQDEIESQRQEFTIQTNDEDDEEPNSFLRGLLQRDETMAASVTHGISSNTIWNMENENSNPWNADEVFDGFQEENSKDIQLEGGELNSTENQYEDPKENENGAEKDENITFSITMDDISSDDESVDGSAVNE